MTSDEWEATVPAGLKSDAVWRVQAFRLGSYIGAVSVDDAEIVATRPWLLKSAAQLSSAGGSIPANITEGYSRLSPKDRIRFYEYALGSVNEAKSRYVTLSRRFDPALVDSRLEVLTSIARLVLKMIHSGRLKPPPPTDPDDPSSPPSP
jgi:four helix bundle protein